MWSNLTRNTMNHRQSLACLLGTVKPATAQTGMVMPLGAAVDAVGQLVQVAVHSNQVD